jgi:modulator of FtsH protease HflK
MEMAQITMYKSPWEGSEEGNIFTKPRKNQFNFNNFQFNFNHKTVFLGLISLLVLWLSSGIYVIQEGEEAVITRFGRFVRKAVPGLNYRLPTPFEAHIIEKVNQSRRIEIGYRSNVVLRPNSDSAKFVPGESTMLTGDENIIELNCDVMWHIHNLEHYVFNILNPEDAVKTAAESAIREVIGKTPIASVLSNQKQEITDKIEALTQKILDQYGVGVSIEKVQLLKAEPPSEVIDAYRDVQTSKADKEREINQAQAYNNDILPKARGEAAKILQESEGYKQEVIAKAEGDSKRFTAVYKQYITNKQLTKDRLYLETAEEVLRGSSKVIISNNSLLPHMAVQQKKSQ